MSTMTRPVNPFSGLDTTESTALDLVLAHLPDAPPDLLAAAQGVRAGMAQLRVTGSTAPAPGTRSADVLTEVVNALLAGQDVPGDAGERRAAAEHAEAAAGRQHALVIEAITKVGADARALLNLYCEDVVTGPLTEAHDVRMAQAIDLVAAHGDRLIDPSAGDAEGAEALRAARRRLRELHAELAPLRRVHVALLRVQQGSSDQMVPGADVSAAQLTNAGAMAGPGWTAAWPDWRSVLDQGPGPRTPSPWEGTPLEVMVLLARHGSWMPTRDDLGTAWRAALATAEPRRSRPMFGGTAA